MQVRNVMDIFICALVSIFANLLVEQEQALEIWDPSQTSPIQIDLTPRPS